MKANLININNRFSILALIVGATVTEAMLLLLPIYIGALNDLLALSATEIGLIGSADLAGIALSVTTAMVWLRKYPWRGTVLWALTLFFATNIVSIHQTNFTVLMALRFAGGLGAGAAYAIALAGICDSHNPARNSALMVCSQVIFGAIGLFVLPSLAHDWRLDGIYLYISLGAILAIVLSYFYFPNNTQTQPSSHFPPVRKFGWQGTLAFAGTSLYFVTIGVVWSYLERIALNTGLSLEDVGFSLSAGYIISLLGSFSAAYFGVKWGTAWPMIVAGSVQFMMLVVFYVLDVFPHSALIFFAANAVFQFFWSYIISYQIVIFSDADKDGRFLPLYGTSVHIALAVGPFLGANMVKDDHYLNVLTFGMVSLTLCYLSFLGSVYLGKKSALSGPTTVGSH